MNPEKKPTGDGQDIRPPKVDLQKLKLAQTKKDQETSLILQQKQAEEEIQKNLQAKALIDLKSRDAILEELKSLQSEVEQLRAQRIEERINNAEKLKADKATKAEELSKTSSELAEADSELEKIKEIIGDKKEDELALEIIEALKQIELVKSEIEKKLTELTEEIKNIEAELISEEQINRYKDILKRMEELNAKIDEIESNPYLIEKLMEEASSEDALRQLVVDAVLSKIETEKKQTREIFSQLVQIFLTEEFKFREFDKIKDQTEKEEEMKKLIQAILSSLNAPADDKPQKLKYRDSSTPREQQQYSIGMVLKVLTGRFGTIGGLNIAMYSASAERDNITNEYIKSYLGVLNYLRAISFTLKSDRSIDYFLNNSVRLGKDAWKSCDQQLYVRKLNVLPDGPLTSIDASDAERKKIQEKFDADSKKINKMEQEFIIQENNRIEKRKKPIEERIEAIKKEMTDLESFLAEAKNQLEQYKKIQEEILEKEKEIEELKSKIKLAGDKLVRQGFFAFSEKSYLKSRIKTIELQISTSSKKINELLKQQKEIYKFFTENSLERMIENTGKTEVEIRLEEMKKEINELERQLDVLNYQLLK